MGKEKGSFSIEDVLNTSKAVRITLRDNNSPGWFSVLDLNANRVSQLIDQKYRMKKSLTDSGIKDRSGFLEH